MLRIVGSTLSGQRFGIGCQTEMSATYNSFAALICMNIRIPRYKKIFVERWPESCLICVWIKALFLQFKTSYRISVVIKQGQHFGIVCQTEMSATRNSFAALICMNIRTRRCKNVCWSMAGKLSKLYLNQGAIFAI